jgi:hypothetical protein
MRFEIIRARQRVSWRPLRIGVGWRVALVFAHPSVTETCVAEACAAETCDPAEIVASLRHGG